MSKNGIDIQQAFELGMQEYEKEFGDRNLGDGESFAVLFDNCVMIVNEEHGNLKVNIVGGEPFRVNQRLSIFKE